MHLTQNQVHGWTALQRQCSKRCLAEARWWFTQASNTPFLKMPLIEIFGEMGLWSTAFDQVLAGTFTPQQTVIHLQGSFWRHWAYLARSKYFPFILGLSITKAGRRLRKQHHHLCCRYILDLNGRYRPSIYWWTECLISQDPCIYRLFTHNGNTAWIWLLEKILRNYKVEWLR